MNNLAGVIEFAKLTGTAKSTISAMKKKKSPGIITQGSKIVVDKSLEACRAYGLLKNSKLIWGGHGKSSEFIEQRGKPKNDSDNIPGGVPAMGDIDDSGGGGGPGNSVEEPDDLAKLILEEKRERIRKLKIDNEKEEGKLVYVDELESLWFKYFRIVRDEILKTCKSESDQAANKSAHEVEMIYTEAMKFVLTNLPETPPQLANDKTLL